MADINDYAEEIKNLFRSIGKNFRIYVSDQISDYNYTVPQMTVMHELFNHPGITLKDLSELVGLAKSTVCGIVDRLEAQGDVIRVRDAGDRRNVKISLSPKLSEITGTVNLVKKNYLAGLLKDMDPAEVEKIIYGLRMMNKMMEDYNKGK